MKLTTAIARSITWNELELPSDKTDHIVWDDDFPGFGVRLRAGRKRVRRMWVYQYQYAGHTRRATIGNVNAIGIENARKIAGLLQSKVRLGDDPVREKTEKIKRAAHTFGNILPDYIEVKKQTIRGWDETRRILEGACKPLHRMPLSAVKRSDIADVLTPIAARGKKAQHNAVRHKLNAFFNWAIEQGFIENNPVRGTTIYKLKSRKRVLSMGELIAISQALGDMTNYSIIIPLLKKMGLRQEKTSVAASLRYLSAEEKIRIVQEGIRGEGSIAELCHKEGINTRLYYDWLKEFLEADKNPELRWRDSVINDMTDYSNVVHLLMLTGQRRSEIGELEYSELRTDKTFVDEGLPVTGPAIVLPAERTKNGHRHIVPLSKAAQAVLLSRKRGKGNHVFARKFKDEAVFERKWTRHKKILDAALAERGYKLEPWVLHDLRRSVATHMGHMGFHRQTIDDVLNHYRANVYNKSKYEADKRRALEAWGEHLMARIEGRKPADNVRPIRA